jgi:hypothetical protein
MKKALLVLGSGVAVLALFGFLALSDPISRSVSVTFLGYTNVDTRGFNDQYKWAWFRIENKTHFMLSCAQGAKDIEREGSWIQTTNGLGRQYDPIIERGRTLTVSVIAPSDATRWRNSFLFMKMDVRDPAYWNRQISFERFMNNLRLQRFGIWGQPWRQRNPKLHVVTSETLNL